MKYLTLVILFALEYKYSDSFFMLIVCIYMFSHSFIFNLFITAFEQNLLVLQTDDAKSFHLRFC